MSRTDIFLEHLSLNSLQRQAVKHTDGHLAIIAGPGTGKTKTVVAKLAYLLRHGFRSNNLLALTFTHKAAAAVSQRLRDTVAGEFRTGLPQTTTFHGWCYAQLIKQAATNGHTAPAIISELDRRQLLSELITALADDAELKTLPDREVSLRLSELKNQTFTTPPSIELTTLLSQYTASLKERQVLDFDDVLLRVLEQATADTLVLPNYSLVIVDEFQDTNQIQYALLKLLLKTAKGCVIGDPNQAIYGFRGATADVFNQYLADFPGTTTITLTDNYRNAPNILAISQSLFPDSPQLVAQADHVQPEARLITTLSRTSEATWVIKDIETKMGGIDLLSAQNTRESVTTSQINQEAKFADFAVLYRTHALRYQLEQTFFESGLPYQIIGSQSVYERPAGMLVRDHLQTLLAPEMTEPDPRPVSTIIKKLFARENNIDLARDFLWLQTVSTQFDQADFPAKAFYDYISTIAEHDYYDPLADRITLLTMHAAKGLEFRFVYLCGFEAGNIPYRRSKDPTELAEEKRLLYVALTRAKVGLYLLSATHPAPAIEIHDRATKKNPKKRSERKLSPFAETLIKAGLIPTIDPAIEKILKRRQKTIDQKRQMRLF